MADRRIGKTKAAIKDAYIDILKDSSRCRDGSKTRVTIAEIARRANIDRKTFYLHYDSTDAILEEIYDSAINETMERMRSESSENGAPVSVAVLFNMMTAMIAENLDTFEALTDRKGGSTLFDKLKQRLITLIANEYKGELGLTETEYKIYAEFFMSGIVSAYNLWISSKLPLRIDELAGMVTAASLKGIEGIIAKENNHS